MSDASVFFDTNILLYLVSQDQAKADRAESLIANGGVFSVQVLNEFAAVAARKFGMKITAIRDVLSTVRSICAIKPLDIETHDLGLDLAERYEFSIYDGLVVAAALRAGCTTLYTEDLQDGQVIGRLTVRNPFAMR